MSSRQAGEVNAGRLIASALADSQPSWITLPSDGGDVPDELRAAMDVFEAGDRPAGRAAAEWLKNEAFASYQTSRTRLLVAEGGVAGFYSLASAHVVLKQRV